MTRRNPTSGMRTLDWFPLSIDDIPPGYIRMPDQLYCVMDYETYSEADLRKVGAWEYSVHPSTEIMCVAFAIGTAENLHKAEIKVWAPIRGLIGNSDHGDFTAFYQVLLDPSIVLVAHNAFFEQCITRNVYAERVMYSKAEQIVSAIGPERWVCTAARAAMLALPRALEHVGDALMMRNRKDTVGARAMLRLAKPRKPSKNDPSTRHLDPNDIETMIAYATKDIAAEIELFQETPPLPPMEKRIWEMDQRINLRGFAVDRPLIKQVIKMMKRENAKLEARVPDIVGGAFETTGQRDKALAWLEEQGHGLPNLKKDTVDKLVKSGKLKGRAKEFIEVRSQLSLVSNKKYYAMIRNSRFDGRVRDAFKYHAASPGRWAGQRVQPQNFKRGVFDEHSFPGAIKALKSGDLDYIDMAYGAPLEHFSNCLRGMIIPAKGNVLDVGDFNAIEPRVLFWLAKEEAGLEEFRKPKPIIYEKTGAKIYGIKLEKVSKGGIERWLGKQTVIGSGYGMGWKKFQSQCEGYGRKLPDELCQTSIQIYRTEFPRVPALWKEIEQAAIVAVRDWRDYTSTSGVVCGKVRFQYNVERGFLECFLPSGRRLYYCDPSVEREEDKWGRPRDVLYFWGIGKNNKWMRERTWGGTLVENIVQAIARDLLAEAMLRIDAHSAWDIVLHAHDECVAERDMFSPTGWDEFKRLMTELPLWARGLPVAVEGWSGTRYRK